MKTTRKRRKAFFWGVLSILLSFISVNWVAAQCVSPPPDMVSWWPGDGDALDIIGSSHGTPQGGVTFAAGKVSQAFSLDGSSGFLDLSDHVAELNFSQPATIDVWVRSTLDDCQSVLEFRDATGFSYVQALAIGNNCTNSLANELITIARANGSVVSYVLGYATSQRGELFDGQVHHIAVTFSGTEVKIFIDGQPKAVTVGSGTNDGTYGGLSNPAIGFIGVSQTSVSTIRYFNGLIDELEVFNRALTAVEIQTIFDAGSAGKCKSDDDDDDGDDDDDDDDEGGPTIITVGGDDDDDDD